MRVDPNSPRAELTKRQEEVLDRLAHGQSAKQIAADIGISRAAVYGHIDSLRRTGALPETYTPSGQPPRGLELDRVLASAPAAGAPRESSLPELRELVAGGGREGYAAAIERAIASADAVSLAYELGRLDATGESGLARELVESALERLGALRPGAAATE